MPYQPGDAPKKTKKAKTPALQSQWSAIANRMLQQGDSEADAIKTANGVIRKRSQS